MKSLNAKIIYPVFINLRYLWLKLLKNRIVFFICYIFHHNFKNIPFYVNEWGIIEKVFILLYLMVDLL